MTARMPILIVGEGKFFSVFSPLVSPWFLLGLLDFRP